ncbi:MAG: GCN5-related N-acetyltransferase [Gemmatimonadetes bacterium]|nr:GCN5-related N-acetyltransferase [Gemmatimonadota bacterium]
MKRPPMTNPPPSVDPSPTHGTESDPRTRAERSIPLNAGSGDAAPGVTIRAATVDDAAPLAALAERIFIDTYAPDTRAEDVAAFVAQAFGPEKQAAELADARSTYLVAEVDGRLAAYAFLRRTVDPPFEVGPAPLEVARFYVAHAWHGRGIAAALMDGVLREAALRGARTVWLFVWERNPRALAFYRKQGFTVVGRVQFLMGTDLQDDHVMSRPLP